MFLSFYFFYCEPGLLILDTKPGWEGSLIFSRGLLFHLIFDMMATQQARWRLARKAVLVHAPDLDNVGCLAHVNVGYNKMQQEGCIAIKVNLRLAESNNENQTIH